MQNGAQAIPVTFHVECHAIRDWDIQLDSQAAKTCNSNRVLHNARHWFHPSTIKIECHWVVLVDELEGSLAVEVYVVLSLMGMREILEEGYL